MASSSLINKLIYLDKEEEKEEEIILAMAGMSASNYAVPFYSKIPVWTSALQEIDRVDK